MIASPSPTSQATEHECRVRDLYAARLQDERPNERLLDTEHSYPGTAIRSDMRTLDRANDVRVWEFEIVCSYTGLGQVLTYLAVARRAEGFERRVRGVLAAFEFQPEILLAVEALNLGLEIVHIPAKYRLAGGVPARAAPPPAPVIPSSPRKTRSKHP